MLVLTVESFSVFGDISEITINYLSDLAFSRFPSFLFSLCILLIYQGLSADAPPPPPGPKAAAAVALTVRAAPPPGPTAAAAVALTVRAAPPRAPRRRRWPLGGHSFIQ